MRDIAKKPGPTIILMFSGACETYLQAPEVVHCFATGNAINDTTKTTNKTIPATETIPPPFDASSEFNRL
jgi:hypothetical protein